MIRRHGERGVTLTEVMVVTILASIVMVGLVSFYISSQATWMDASTQALTQREGTLLLQAIATRVHSARDVTVTGPVGQSTITLDYGSAQSQFMYEASDSSVVEVDTLGNARRATVSCKVERFDVDADSTLVYVRDLVLISPMGQRVSMQSTMRLYNRP